MTSTSSVVTAGYMPLDIVRSDGRTLARHAGGTAANVAAILAFLGWTAYLAGEIGTDPASDELTSDLARAGVSTRFVMRRDTVPTVRLVHDVGHNRHTYLYRCPVCGLRFPRSRPLTLAVAKEIADEVPAPTAYFFDRANSATVWLAEVYASRDCTVVFEPSVSSADAALFRRGLAAATIVKHSDDYSAQLETRLEQDGGRPIQITTHGAGGLEMRRAGHRPQRLAAFPTIALDTAGAGDWTTAGFLHRYRGSREPTLQDLTAALRFGQALAAVNCSVVGARGAMELHRTTVLRRAKSVLDSGALTATPRVRYREPPGAPAGVCPSCLMPSAIDVPASEPVTGALGLGDVGVALSSSSSSPPPFSNATPHVFQSARSS